MNWEVSSMPSKRSFFNVTLFRKNMSRSWPLWGSLTAAGCLIPLYLLLARMAGTYDLIEPSDFVSMLYGTATAFVPAFTLVYAILVAMMVWGYLYTPRSVGMMHTLPVDRTNLFLTGVVSGFAMLLIPYAVVGGLLSVMALVWGFFDALAVLNTVAAVVLMNTLFFGMATLCAMVTGHVFALPAFYLVLNFLAPAADWLISSLAKEFLVGVSTDYSGALEFLSPVVQIYQSFQWEGVYTIGDERTYVLQGLGVVVVYGLVGAAMLAASLVIYLRRRSESAGDMVAFRWLRPLFRMGVAIVSALTLGRLLYAMIWANLFQSGNYADAVPMTICMALAGVIGYLAAAMLLEKNLRLTRGNLPGAAVVCAVAAVICFCLGTDILGVERRVPETDQIASVELYVSGANMNTTLYPAKDPELVELVRQLHTAIADEADEIRESRPTGRATLESDYERTQAHEYIRIDYRLDDGRELRRYYNLRLDRTEWESGQKLEGALRRLMGHEDMLMQRVVPPEQGSFDGLYVYCYRSGKHSSDEDHSVDEEVLYEALLRDAREGNIINYDPFDPFYYETLPVSIDLEFRVKGSRPYDGVYYRGSNIELRASMIHTMQALVDMEFITVEELTEWVSEMKYPDKVILPVEVMVQG